MSYPGSRSLSALFCSTINSKEQTTLNSNCCYFMFHALAHFQINAHTKLKTIPTLLIQVTLHRCNICNYLNPFMPGWNQKIQSLRKQIS